MWIPGREAAKSLTRMWMPSPLPTREKSPEPNHPTV